MKKAMFLLGFVVAVFLTTIAYAASPGNALYFNGNARYVIVPNVIDGLENLTIEVWFKTDITNQWRWIYGQDQQSSNSTRIELRSGVPRVLYSVRTTTGDKMLYGTNDFVTDAWNHVAMTYDGSTLRGYLNGVLDGEVSASGNVYSPYPQYIGASTYYLNECFWGKIDEVRIWGVARTQTEIQENMGKLLTGDEPGLRAYWRFDEGVGQFATDKSRRRRTGVLGSTTGADSNDPMWVKSDFPLDDALLLDIVLNRRNFHALETVRAWVHVTNGADPANVMAKIWLELPGGGFTYLYDNLNLSIPANADWTVLLWEHYFNGTEPGGDYFVGGRFVNQQTGEAIQYDLEYFFFTPPLSKVE